MRFYFKKDSRLNSEEATADYLRESAEGENIWWLLCKAVAILVSDIKTLERSEAAGSCNDNFYMVTNHDNAETLLRAHQAHKASQRRWRMGKQIIASAAVGAVAGTVAGVGWRKYKAAAAATPKSMEASS